MPTAKPSAVPALIYPAHGCPPVGSLTQAEIDAQMRQQRQFIREHWNQPAVKAIIELLEMRTALTTQRAIAPDATAHDQGGAYHLMHFLNTLIQIPATTEIG